MRRAQLAVAAGIAVAVALTGGTLRAQQGRGGFGLSFGQGVINLAANEAVQKDLGLSGDIAGKITALRDDYRAAIQKEYSAAGIELQNFANLTAEQRQKMVEIVNKLNEEFTPKVKELLSADQFKRLKQIQLQAQGASGLLNPDVVAELKITDEQRGKLRDLQAEYTGKQRELFTGGGDFQERAAKMRELNSEHSKKAEEILTAEQKEKLAALKGSAFDVSQLRFGGRRPNN